MNKAQIKAKKRRREVRESIKRASIKRRFQTWGDFLAEEEVRINTLQKRGAVRVMP